MRQVLDEERPKLGREIQGLHLLGRADLALGRVEQERHRLVERLTLAGAGVLGVVGEDVGIGELIHS